MTKLTQEETAQLCLLVQTDPKSKEGKDALETLVVEYISFIRFCVKKYFIQGAHLKQDDLIQEGTIGFIKAVKRYKPLGGASLATFSKYYIEEHCYDASKDQGKLIRIPVHVYRSTNKHDPDTMPFAITVDLSAGLLDFIPNIQLSEQTEKLGEAFLLLDVLSDLEKEIFLKINGIEGDPISKEALMKLYNLSEQKIKVIYYGILKKIADSINNPEIINQRMPGDHAQDAQYKEVDLIKQIILMKDEQRLTYREISKLVNLPLTTTKRRYDFGKKTLNL